MTTQSEVGGVSTARPEVAVARGEMQEPWTDYSGNSSPAGGPLLDALVAHLGLDGARRVLVVGPHTRALLDAIATATGGELTVLVRGVHDANALSEQGVRGTIIAGALDGFVESAPEPFDAIVALDGLDRVLSYDSERLSFEETMRLLLGLAGDDARAVIAHPYDAAPVNVLDARVARDRTADDEFRPFHADPTRPTTAEALIGLVDDLTTDGASDLVTVFGPASAPRLAVAGGPETLDTAPAGMVTYIVQAAHSHRRPLLAQPDEFIRTLARGGRLGDAADGGIVLLGTQARFDLARVAPGGTLVVADYDDERDQFSVIHSAVADTGWPDEQVHDVTASDTAQPSETARYLTLQSAPQRQSVAQASVDTDLLEPHFGLGSTVEDEFVQLAVHGDVPGFRELAGAIGSYVESLPVTERRVVTFDNLHLAGRDFAAGTEAGRWGTSASTSESLAAAFWLLQDRFRADHLRQPWPDHVQGESLVGMWLEMAGQVPDGDSVQRGRTLADAIEAWRPTPSGSIPDLRTALADAGRARRELAEAQGQVFGLERTIGFRDKQLRTREQVIRNLRANGGGGAAAGQQARANTVVRMAKRTAQVRSVGELTAGLDRVLKRAKRNRAVKAGKK